MVVEAVLDILEKKGNGCRMSSHIKHAMEFPAVDKELLKRNKFTLSPNLITFGVK